MIDSSFLLNRLPAFVRERDREIGGPLEALLGIIAQQGAIVEADIAQLYDNWFIETCEPWLIPYIGDLLGVRGLYSVTGVRTVGQRAYVANTLGLRRRKGTLPVLEQIAFDTTGWRARAVEFFQLLGTTQHVNHIRLANVRPDLRNAAQLELVDGPFDRSVHTAEVRPLPDGRYNIPNIGLFVWRLRAYAVARTVARHVTTLPGFYTFDPIGRTAADGGKLRPGALFNRPRTEAEISHLAEPINVPEPLSRRVLHDELSALRQALTDAESTNLVYFRQDAGGAVLRIWLDGTLVPTENLIVCNLSPLPGSVPEEWRRPSLDVTVKATRPGRPDRTFPTQAGQFLVGFDPVLGRIALPAGKTATRVEVAYAYGFVGDVGGGPYDRRPVDVANEPDDGLLVASDFDVVLRVPADHPTLALALAAVKAGSRTLLQLQNDSVEQAVPNLNLPDTHLAIQADNFKRPFIVGDLVVSGNENTRLSLSGIFLDGALSLAGRLRSVDLRHCTLTPDQGGILHQGTASELSIQLSHVLCGPVKADHAIASITARNSVFDAANALALELSDTALTLERCSVFGGTRAGTLVASDCIFTDLVAIGRRQEGCVRFCYVPQGSTTPRRHRCQPDLVTQSLSEPLASAERARVTPAFTSVQFGHPAYAQLSRTTASEIRAGADNGAEMGVWNVLQEPQREANLRQALAEYLRFGLEAAPIFVN